MKLKFTKMHSLGNDFMVIDGITQTVKLNPRDIRKLADRHTGVGFDQCLIAYKSKNKEADFFYQIYNADGTEVGQCGNGARCMARFLRLQGLTQKNKLTLATLTTQFAVTLDKDEAVVSFAQAIFKPEDIPMNFPNVQETYPIFLIEKKLSGHALSLGNPHMVLLVQDVSLVEVKT